MNFFKEHREEILPEQVGIISAEEQAQIDFQKLTPEQKASYIRVAEKQAHKINDKIDIERREELIRRGKNPDQKELF